MNQVIPREWLDEYLRKSGDDKLSPGNLVVLPYGFVIWNINDDGDLLLSHVYVAKGKGNGRKMDEFTKSLARRIGAKKIVFATRRNPVGFMRKYGYKVIGFILEKEVD